jgi:hypothetical protein
MIRSQRCLDRSLAAVSYVITREQCTGVMNMWDTLITPQFLDFYRVTGLVHRVVVLL